MAPLGSQGAVNFEPHVGGLMVKHPNVHPFSLQLYSRAGAGAPGRCREQVYLHRICSVLATFLITMMILIVPHLFAKEVRAFLGEPCCMDTIRPSPCPPFPIPQFYIDISTACMFAGSVSTARHGMRRHRYRLMILTCYGGNERERREVMR